MTADLDLAVLSAQIPALDCRGLCQDSCGPIEMSQREFQRIAERVGTEEMACTAEHTCPLLQEGRCSVYPIRPLICRLWGVVETMPCPHGCVPTRWLSQAEGFAILASATRVSEGRTRAIR